MKISKTVNVQRFIKWKLKLGKKHSSANFNLIDLYSKISLQRCIMILYILITFLMLSVYFYISMHDNNMAFFDKIKGRLWAH